MQFYRFFKHELSSNHVINKMIELEEKEKSDNKHFLIDRDSYVWTIGEEITKKIFPDRPTRILGIRAIYEEKGAFVPLGIRFEIISAIRGRTCENCRFNESCPYRSFCVDQSHWLEMTEAQKFEKVMALDIDSLHLHDMPAKKLVGDISSGYSYVNPYTVAQIEESKRRAKEMKPMIDTDNIFRHIINSVYGVEKINYNEMYVKKEDKDMRRNLCIGYTPGGPVGNPQDLIEDVIFSGPCTIVKWKDGDKTIVRCQDGECFDKEKGLALCIIKKFFGTNYSKSNYNDIFKKWCDDEDEVDTNNPFSTLKDFMCKRINITKLTHYSVKTYSEKFGINESKVRKMCREGELNAHKQDGAWIIDIKE